MLQSVVTLLSMVSLNLQRIENLERMTAELNSTCTVTAELRERVQRLELLVADLYPGTTTTEVITTEGSGIGIVDLTTVQTTTIESGLTSGDAHPDATTDERDLTSTKTKESTETAAVFSGDHLYQVTTDGITQNSTKAIKTTETGSCPAIFNGICYWTYVGDYNINFQRAEEICRNKQSIPAYFPNEQVYNRLVEDVRAKAEFERSWVGLWTGITIDTSGNVNRPTYTNWYPSQPVGNFRVWSHIYLEVSKDPSNERQGLANLGPQSSLHGIVCQKDME